MNNLGEFLKNNVYPGRGIVIGKSKDCVCIAYFLMGRSSNSRNRILLANADGLITKAFDESKLEDPSLIIYSPIRKLDTQIIVSNGDQTDTIYEGLLQGRSFEKSLETREFEPDAPNFTPRISGIVELAGGNITKGESGSITGANFSYKLSVLKKADDVGSACNRFTFTYSPLQNKGHFIHTYHNDPTISFAGEPMEVEIPDNAELFAKEIWENLNDDNKISLFVNYMNLESLESTKVIINKNK